MNRDRAQEWVVISALVVGGIYLYRRMTETAQTGNLSNILGIGDPVPLSQFVTAWGFLYFMLALAAEAAPGLGGSMAILVATTDFLTNAPAFLSDVNKQQAVKLSSANTSSSQATIGHLDANLQAGKPLTGVSKITTTPPAGLKP